MPRGMPKLRPTLSQISALARLHEAGYVKLKDLQPASRDEATAAISAAAEKVGQDIANHLSQALIDDYMAFRDALGEDVWIGGPRPWGGDSW